ncbi:MAG: Gfo/Idh/MocA family oxidoreductase [Verrucomicrobia bacterium]|nr:Gfo/Idh/MocA family oxidoreductase [Verrucomicrobiota bacterium]
MKKTDRAGKNIRLGLIRCDTHGYWYGPFLAPCDPLLLEKHDHEVHHYFSKIAHADQLRVQPVSGFELVKVWDADPVRAANFAKTFLGTAQVCTSLKEMAKDIDAAFIADCGGDGADHVQLARPFLERGIPTYVDKPFANNLQDARILLNLAKKHRTSVMSASLLEHLPVVKRFRARFEEIAPVGLVVAKGLSGYGLAGIIHGIGLARGLLGDGVEWVQAMGESELAPNATPENNRSYVKWKYGKRFVAPTFLHMHYRTGQEGLVINTSSDIFPDECWFYASAFSKRGAIHSPPMGDPEFLAGGEVIVRLFKQMVLTGKPTVPYESLLEKIAIVEAGRLAQKRGGPVHLKELLN